MAVDYDALRTTSRTTGRPVRFDEETRRERAREQNRRTALAQSRATMALQRAFPTEWRELYNAARAEVYAERGPLPGDEGPT